MIENLEEEVEMLDRHLKILKLVIEREPIGIVKLSNETDYVHHEVRYSLRILEEENLIEPSDQGAITTSRTEGFVADLDEKIDATIKQLETMKVSQHLEAEN